MFKFDIGDLKSKRTFHLEAEAESLIGMKLGEIVKGENILPELAGYEFIIKGASDKSGFPALQNIEGSGIRRVLLKKGKGMKAKRKGLRLRKSIRGNTISTDIVQINLKVSKEGKKPLEEIFGKKEAPKVAEEKSEAKKEEKALPEKKSEEKEEKK